MKRHEHDHLELLSRVDYARTNVLAAALGGNLDWRQRQLQDLTKRGIVRRHNPSGNGDKGASYPQNWPRIYSLPSRKDKLNDHDTNVTDIVLSAKAAARVADIPFQFYDELLRGKDLKLKAEAHDEEVDKGKVWRGNVMPDALFALGSDIYILEFDHGTEDIDATTFKKKSWRRSLRQYQHIFQNRTFTDWDVADLKLLCVFDNARRMQNVMDLMSEKLELKSARILFKAYPTLRGTLARTESGFEYLKAPEPLLTILDDEWQRVGHLPFTLRRRT